MQALFWLAVRAFTKLGIAMAASNPMMATTIMISTSVKPDFRLFLIFICNYFPFFFCGVNDGGGVGYYFSGRSQIASRQPQGLLSNGDAKTLPGEILPPTPTRIGCDGQVARTNWLSRVHGKPLRSLMELALGADEGRGGSREVVGPVAL